MIQDLDFAVLNWIQNNLKCGFLDFLMPKISFLGEKGVFFVAFALILLIIQRYRRAGVTLLGGMTAGLLIGNLILKNLVARVRPCLINADVALLVAVPSDASFPSGHSLHAFLFATVLMHFDKRLGIPAMVLAVLIAFSRMYLYLHFPSDVLAGAAIGVGIALLSCLVSDRIAKKWNDRTPSNAQ